MSTERNDTAQPRPDAPTASPPAISYQPPALAWEEPFEATVATSCALVAGTSDGCSQVPAA